MRFDNILFPVDFSDSCSELKADVEWIARRFNSSVTLLHVFEIPPAWYGMGDTYALNTDWLSEIMQQARNRLDEFTIDLPPLQVKRVLLEGQAAAEIREYCHNNPVDLVAMATHGHGALEGLLMGSVAAKVLHNVSAPLWLRPPEATKLTVNGQFRIVCGIDLGEETVPVLRYAKNLAQALNASVTVVHSVAEDELRPNKYFDYDLHKTLKSMAENDLALLQKNAGTDFATLVTDFQIGQALTTAVGELKANLVVIGRGHSRRFMGRFRTHTYDLLNQVQCPVFSYCPAVAEKQTEEMLQAVVTV